MGANILDILNGATLAQAGNSEDYQEISLDFSEIVVTKHNKYSMGELEEMATGLLMDGLQEPLVVGLVNGAYWLVSGHRRMAGIEILLGEGHERFRQVPCRYKGMTETEFRFALLVGNTFNRRMTDYDLMVQAQEWKEVLTQARKDGTLKLDKGQRVRDYVALALGESTGKIGTLETINKATPEIKEQFQSGNMGITAAGAAAALPEDRQREIAAQVAAGEDVKAEEIKAIAEAEKKKKTVEEQQQEQSVSDTDTSEEEKANAAKLHTLKMLGNYYTWMNEEEHGILGRILEDCKRRKREYALPTD